MNAGAHDSSGDAGGKITIADEANTSASFANVFDEFFVARAIENDDDEVFDVAVETFGDGFEIVGNRGVKIDSAFAGRADDDFFHVQIRSVKKAAAFAGGENGNGIWRAGGAEIGAFERVDSDIHGGKIRVWSVGGEADFFADVKHRRFVALAFTDDDDAVHLERVHGLAHGFDGDFVGFVAITEAHGAGGGDGGVFYDAQKFETQLRFHENLPEAAKVGCGGIS